MLRPNPGASQTGTYPLKFDDDIPDWLDELCDRFEAEWTSDKPTNVESFLNEIEDAQRSIAIKSLLELEFELRAGHGDKPSSEELRQRFPDDLEIVENLLQNSTPIDSLALEETLGTLIHAGERDFVKLTDSLSVPVTLGRYQIKRRIGRGAMGTVFLADDQQLDRQVALKVPHGDLQRHAEVRARFEREARACAALRHAGICPVYDVCEVDGIHFICMGYIDGQTLAEYANSNSPLEEEAVAQIALKIASALATAHDAGVVHRDLKPSNVMIDLNGEPVILDFGLAIRLDADNDSRLTQEGALVGSPAYMSPEQVSGDQQEIDARTDIYSLGVLMYELLTGRLPFEGTTTSVLGKIIIEEPPPPSTFRVEMSAKLEDLVTRLMARDADDRPQAMCDVIDDLHVFRKDRSAESPRPAEFGQLKGKRASASSPKPRFAMPWLRYAGILALVGVIAGASAILHIAKNRDAKEVVDNNSLQSNVGPMPSSAAANWVDLLKTSADLEPTAGWTTNDSGALEFTGKGVNSFALNHQVWNSYELECVARPSPALTQLAFTLPLRESFCAFILRHDRRAPTDNGGLEDVDGIDFKTNSVDVSKPLLSGAELVLRIRVETSASKTSISAYHHDQLVLEWQGDSNRLSLVNHWNHGQTRQIGIGGIQKKSGRVACKITGLRVRPIHSLNSETK